MTTISIAAIGDLLMGKQQIEAAKVGDDQYVFYPIFDEIVPYLKSADLTIANLETTLSGREENYIRPQPTRSWASFNCPDELATALARAGIHVLSTANNHSLDREAEGLKRTLDVLDRNGIRHTGTARSYDEAQSDLICAVKGVRVGILAFTYGTNRMPIPADEPWIVNLIDEKLFGRVQALSRKVDLTIVCLHHGTEYMRHPNEKQLARVQACFEHGADIILGAHPHVLQPMAVKSVRDLDGVVKSRFVIHSLGNCTCRRMVGLRAITSVILQLEARKLDDGTAVLTRIGYVPTFFSADRSARPGGHKVIPIEPYLRDDDALGDKEKASVRKAWAYVQRHLGPAESLAARL